MHPVGPLSPRVYWVRRVIIIVVALVVLLGLVYLVLGRRSADVGASGSSSSSTSSSAPSMTGVLAATSPSTSSSSSSSSSSSVAAPSSESSAVPEAPAPVATTEVPVSESVAEVPVAETPVVESPVEPPAPEVPPTPAERVRDPQGRALCWDHEIGVTAVAAGPFATGSQPLIAMVVQNVGAEECTRDVSGTLQIFTVLTEAGEHVWSTADCFPGEGTEIRTLAPAQTVQYDIKWGGKTSAPGCAGDRVPVPAGKYQLVAALGGLQSAPAPFEITG